MLYAFASQKRASFEKVYVRFFRVFSEHKTVKEVTATNTQGPDLVREEC